MVNYSLIIDTLKSFMYHSQVCDISVLKGIATSRGCGEEETESCINGAIRDIISNKVSSKDNNVIVIGPDGSKVEVPQYNPTQKQLINYVKEAIKGITDERVQAIISKMLEKGFLIEDPTNQKLYRGTVPLPNSPFIID